MTTHGPAHKKELERILRDGDVTTRFQPLLSANDGRLFAHEALLRGPADSALHEPLALFAEAQAANRSIELDLLALECSLRAFTARDVPGKLFVNILPETVERGDLPDHLRRLLHASALDPQRLVIEITEHGTQLDAAPLCAEGRRLRQLGCEIAIDDFGTGISGLKVWSELRPDYVKVDRYFIARIETDPVAVELLRAMMDMAHVLGSRVVAEGIETECQLELLRNTGVDYLQGYYISRPLEQATDQTGNYSVKPIPEQELAEVSCVGDLCFEREPIIPQMRIADAVALFRSKPQWESLPVVQDGRPVGLLLRDALLLLLSKPLYPEIYNPKPVSKVMDTSGLVVDERSRLSQASRLITRNRQSRINEEFIVARDGRYLGLARSVELLHYITEERLREAQQSNPLTLLPGNREIDSEVFRLSALQVPFVICHADIDHFKPFNDQYGYSQGDQVLLHLAGLCRSAAVSGMDFVGHPGGDDFIMVMRSTDWSRRIARIVDSFAASCQRFYSADHIAAGGFRGADRDGSERHFPLMTLSVGAAVVDPARQGSKADLMRALGNAKQMAKSRAGNAMIVNDGETDRTMRMPALAVAS
jgi:EAL domain-containing protein (putative c-di-GMP-specific phosphodiesterase class I)/GGDEF domain-containing protein